MTNPFLNTKRTFIFVIILSGMIIPGSLIAQEFNGTFAGQIDSIFWCTGSKQGEKELNIGKPGGRYIVAAMPQNSVLTIEHD